jgi:DNA-binding NarL/FixJ family response regulator
VAEGECVIDPTIVARLLARQRDSGPLTHLTDRERDVLTLMAEGHSNQAICDKLVLSPETVEAHISQIFSKLGLRDAPGYHRRVLAVLPSCAPNDPRRHLEAWRRERFPGRQESVSLPGLRSQATWENGS